MLENTLFLLVACLVLANACTGENLIKPKADSADLPQCQTTLNGRNDSSECLCRKNKPCPVDTKCVMVRGSGFLDNICLPDVPVAAPNCRDVPLDFYYRPTDPFCICGQLGVCFEGEYCFSKSKDICLKDFPVEPSTPKLEECTSELVEERQRCICKSEYECPLGFVCDLDGQATCTEDKKLQSCTKDLKEDCRCHGDVVCPGGYVCDLQGDYFSCISKEQLEKLVQKENSEQAKYEQEMQEAAKKKEEEEKERKRIEEERLRKEEEEKIKKEEEERLQREEEERLKMEEEEERRKQEEEEEREKKQKEAAEKAEAEKAAAEKAAAEKAAAEKAAAEKAAEKLRKKQERKKNRKEKKPKQGKKNKGAKVPKETASMTN